MGDNMEIVLHALIDERRPLRRRRYWQTVADALRRAGYSIATAGRSGRTYRLRGCMRFDGPSGSTLDALWRGCRVWICDDLSDRELAVLGGAKVLRVNAGEGPAALIRAALDRVEVHASRDELVALAA